MAVYYDYLIEFTIKYTANTASGELLLSHFDQIPATLTETFRHVAACNTDISSGGLHGAARSLLRTVWCKIAALSTLGRTPDVYVIGLSRRT